MNISITIQGKSLREMMAVLFRDSKEALLKEMADILKTEGYSVIKSGDWESPKEICERLGISLSGTFNRRMKNRPLAASFSADIVRGPSGRVLFVQSNLFFDDYLKGNLKR